MNLERDNEEYFQHNNNDIEDSFSDDDMKISKRKDFSFEDEEKLKQS